MDDVFIADTTNALEHISSRVAELKTVGPDTARIDAIIRDLAALDASVRAAGNVTAETA